MSERMMDRQEDGSYVCRDCGTTVVEQEQRPDGTREALVFLHDCASGTRDEAPSYRMPLADLPPSRVH